MVPAFFQCQKHGLLLAGPAEARGSRWWFTRGLLRRKNREDPLFDILAAGQELWAREGGPDGWVTHNRPESKHIQMDRMGWIARGGQGRKKNTRQTWEELVNFM